MLLYKQESGCHAKSDGSQETCVDFNEDCKSPFRTATML